MVCAAAVMTTLLGGVATKLWTSYNRSLAVNPLLTKSLTSFSGFILGDGIAQLATKGRENYDFARTARFAAFGFCIHAPGCHYFYHLLDAVVFPAAPKSYVPCWPSVCSLKHKQQLNDLWTALLLLNVHSPDFRVVDYAVQRQSWQRC